MIPFGNETVTIIRRVETVIDGKTSVGYKKETIDGCSWRRIATAQRVDREIVRGENIVCRMPPTIAPPACGDVFLLGTIKTTPANSADLDAIIESHRKSGAFRIVSVTDNTRPGFPLPHYAARGE